MNDDLVEFVTRELRSLSADTADCPTLTLRVAAGVRRRQRRQRVVGVTLAAVAAAVLMPALVFGTSTAGGSANSALRAPHTGTIGSANLALRRANPDVAEQVPQGGDHPSCARRLYCHGPV
jgi:hypothetical protein